MKSFLKDTKKTVILGLIGSVLRIAEYMPIIIIYSRLSIDLPLTILLLCVIDVLPFIFYFVVVLLRINKRKANIKVANTLLIILCIIFLILNIRYLDIKYIILYATIILYLCNIFYREFKFINNKIFAIVVIIISVYNIVIVIINGINTYAILAIIARIANMLIIPYFYNYYEILKEERLKVKN